MSLEATAMYLKHLAVAWAGLFTAMFAVGIGLAGTPLDRLFDMPGAGPFFPGALALGYAAGFLMARRHPVWAAALVFIPPLCVFLCDAYGYFSTIAPYGGWASVWRNEFSNNCGASECGSELFFTQPLFATLGYSFGALVALATGARPGSRADPLRGKRMPEAAAPPPQVGATREWTPLAAIAAGVASLFVSALLVLSLFSLRVPGLSSFQSGQLVAFIGYIGAAAVLAASAMLATGKRGLAGLTEGIGWKGGRRAIALSVGSGVAVAGIVEVFLFATHGAWRGAGLADAICSALPAVVAAPLFEESYFRGILQPALAKRLGPAVSFLIVTLVSSLVHGPFMFTAMPGMALFGFIRLRTASVKNCCLAHAAYNFCMAVLALLL